METAISKIEYYLPQSILLTEELAHEFNKDSLAIHKNTGIHKRHVRSANQIGSDLGYEAAKKLLESHNIRTEIINVNAANKDEYKNDQIQTTIKSKVYGIRFSNIFSLELYNQYL
jgi:3-oxoacyl-[acyl-carrier-protein] synthase III